MGILKRAMFCCVCALVFFIAFAQAADKYAKRIILANKFLTNLMEVPDAQIPKALLQDCKGIIIVRQYRAGWVVSAKGGVGIAMVKDEKTGKWSPPAFVKSGEGSFGLQVGGQEIDSVFLIMNKEGMEMLMKTKFKIGVDASAAAGPVGRDVEAKIGPGTAILVYSRARGLYAGAAFEAGVLLSDREADEAFYKVKGITMEQILFENRVKMPKEAQALAEDLDRYAGVETQGQVEK